MTLSLRRGDRATIGVSGLVDAEGDPTTFAVGDIVHWTAKLRHGDDDDAALIVKTSSVDPGGITFTPGTDEASIEIFPVDWVDIFYPVDQGFVWDLQIVLDGDATQVVTAASGDGVIEADVTLAVP